MVVESGPKWVKSTLYWSKTRRWWVKALEQMFLGEFDHTVDDKGRLTIPARFRPDLAQGLIVTRWLDGCLALYPSAEWGALVAKVDTLPITNRGARDFRRFVFGSATESAPDRQGRVLIPAYLREYASIGGEVTVVGMNTYIEVWNPETWQAVRQNVEDDEVNAERWAELGI
jgi:MraZ protein